MYTKTIRKIFESKNAFDFKEASTQAVQCGYLLVLWNGRIFIYDDFKWILTPFDIDDFKINIK